MHKRAIDHLSKDETLKGIIEKIELSPAQKEADVYANLIASIVSQQLSVKAANTIHGRLLDLFKDQYPDPKVIIEMELEGLRSVGLSRQKASYIQNVAQFFINEKLLKRDWSKIDNDSIIKQLTEIKGVGKWTVQMILMFTLKRPDVFPVDDLGIRNAMIKWYGLEGKYSKTRADQKMLNEALLLIAAPWRPYRTLACRYLWKSLDE